MIRYFLAVPPRAEQQAIAVRNDLKNAGLVDARDGEENETEACKAADFLFVLLTDPDQIDMPQMRRMWELFDNEIRWKRKPNGEILFLVQEESALKNLPLRLRNCGYYLLQEAADAAAYCVEKVQRVAESDRRKSEAAPAVKQIEYSPAAESVKQIEFSVRAPRVESFDGSVTPSDDKPQHSSACKKDHVFDEMLQRDIVKQQEERKKSRVGCCLAFAILFIFVAVAIGIVIAVVTQNSAYTGFALQNGEFAAEFGEKARIFAPLARCAAAANALQGALCCGII